MSSIADEIRPETASIIRASAEARGLSVDEFLLDLLVQENNEAGVEPFYRNATTAEWIKAFSEWTASHPTLPNVADDSRESIYQGRGE
jgi:hypothetical protein